MKSPESIINTTRQAFKKGALPIATAIALTAGGCSPILTRFPDCKIDPQTKHTSETVGTDFFLAKFLHPFPLVE